MFFSLILSYKIEKCKYCNVNDNIIIQYNNVYLYCLIAVLVFTAGFRYNVGTDYWNYYTKYILNLKELFYSIINYNEPGIKMLSFVGRLIYDNGISLIFLSSLITISLYIITLYRYSPQFLVSIILYIFMGEWQGSFNGIRQYLAAALLFWGHRYILNRKFKQYLIIVVIASLFHTTAIVMLSQYFILNRKPDIKNFIQLFIGAIFLLFSYRYIFFGIEFYKDAIMNMTDNYLINSVSRIRIIITWVPIIVFFLFNKGYVSDKINAFYINALILNGLVMFATMNSTYLARIGIYTNSMCLIGYPYLLEDIRNKKKVNILIPTLFFYFLYWIYSVAFSSLKNFYWWFQYK